MTTIEDSTWQKTQTENSDLRKENLKLQQALKKSTQSLSEAKALLELKKKVNLFLKESEDN